MSGQGRPFTGKYRRREVSLSGQELLDESADFIGLFIQAALFQLANDAITGVEYFTELTALREEI